MSAYKAVNAVANLISSVATFEIRGFQERNDGDQAKLAEEQMGRAGEMERGIRFKLTVTRAA
jgi:hypothetical protein